MSNDTMTGTTVLNRDAQTGILFIGQCAYNGLYSAFKPLANVASYHG